MDQALRNLLVRHGVITDAQLEREQEYYDLQQTLSFASPAARERAQARLDAMIAEDREQSPR